MDQIDSWGVSRLGSGLKVGVLVLGFGVCEGHL